MINKTALGALCALVLVAGPCKAENVSGDALFDDIFYSAEFIFNEEDESLIFQFLGDQEAGAIGFFITPDMSSKYEEDYLAPQLNRISPAAGIRFTLDFSL